MHRGHRVGRHRVGLVDGQGADRQGEDPQAEADKHRVIPQRTHGIPGRAEKGDQLGASLAETLDAGTLAAMNRSLRDSGRKARHAVVDLRRIGLTQAEAMRIFRAAEPNYTGRLESVLLI